MPLTISRPAKWLDSVGMVWDMGAHRTIIAEEVLVPSFRHYLQTPVYDPYRSPDGCSVQVDAEVALTNKIMLVNALAVVVPQAKMPNQLLGILFGQISCINCLRYESTPREFLVAKGENVAEDLWGDFVIKEYVDGDGNIIVV